MYSVNWIGKFQFDHKVHMNGPFCIEVICGY